LIAFEIIEGEKDEGKNRRQSPNLAVFYAECSSCTTKKNPKPLAVNLAGNIMLRLNGRKKHKIKTTLYPLQGKIQPEYIKKLLKSDVLDTLIINILFTSLFPTGLLLLTTIFMMSPIEERVNKVIKVFSLLQKLIEIFK
jgi:hypothetical protein